MYTQQNFLERFNERYTESGVTCGWLLYILQDTEVTEWLRHNKLKT